MQRMLATALAALFLLWPTAAVHAQAWPSKPIRFVISFGPGSASDAISRILTQELSAQLGQPVAELRQEALAPLPCRTGAGTLQLREQHSHQPAMA